MPLVGISVRNTRDPELRAGGTGGLFCHRLAREGFPVTKPPHSAQAGLIPEPDSSRQAEALGDARRRTCPDLPGPGPHGPLSIGTRGLLRTRRGLGYNVYNKIS